MEREAKAKSQSEKSEETRGLGEKKDRGGPAGTEKKVFFFCGGSPRCGGRPKKGGGPRETNKQKTKHFFSFLKRRTPYVIRRGGYRALLLRQNLKNGDEDE